MEKVASAAMRHCLRTGRSFRCQTPNSASKCVATSICAARNVMTSSTPPSSAPSPRASPRTPTTLRSRQTISETISRQYSSESSIQGTIGDGPAGIPEEAARERELLEAPEHLNDKEKEIWQLLMDKLECTSLEVQDISGGCGSMYGINAVSERFRGISMLKQQRLVNDVLGDEIKSWHGVQLKTRAP